MMSLRDDSISMDNDPNAIFKKNIRCLYNCIDDNIDLIGECNGSLFNEFFKKIYAMFAELKIPENEFDYYIYALLENASFFEIMSYFLSEDFTIEPDNEDFINRVIKYYGRISSDTKYSNTSFDINRETLESPILPQVEKSCVLSNNEIILLFKNLSKNPDNEESIHDIFEKCLPLVLYFISQETKNCKIKIDDSDLFQEGCIILLNTIKNYDYKKGTDFRAYLEKSIYNEINNYLIKSNSSLIPIPLVHYPFIKSFLEEIDNYISTFKEMPSLDKLKKMAKKLGIPKYGFQPLIKCSLIYILEAQDYDSLNIVNENRIFLGLYLLLPKEELCNLLDVIKNYQVFDNYDVDIDALNGLINEDLINLLKGITSPQDYKLLYMKFVLDYTYDHIAEVYGLTAEDIRLHVKHTIERFLRLLSTKYGINEKSIKMDAIKEIISPRFRFK